MSFEIVKRLALALIAMFTVAPITAVSGATGLVCPGCGVERMIVAARASGPGTVYVWNPSDGVVSKYVNRCGTNFAGDDARAIRVEAAQSPYGACGGGTMATDASPVEPELAEAAPHLGKLWVATNGTWVLGSRFSGPTRGADPYGLRIALPAGFGDPGSSSPTAHDFPLDSALRAKIADFVDTDGTAALPADLRTAIQYVKTHVAPPPFAPSQGITLRFAVVFADGSRVAYTQHLGALPRYVAETARDRFGHALPEANTPKFAGKWAYAANQADARDRLLALFDRLNAGVSYVDRDGGRVDCPWNGHTLHCTVHR